MRRKATLSARLQGRNIDYLIRKDNRLTLPTLRRLKIACELAEINFNELMKVNELHPDYIAIPKKITTAYKKTYFLERIK